jgi:Rieske Fe-S protein
MEALHMEATDTGAVAAGAADAAPGSPGCADGTAPCATRRAVLAIAGATGVGFALAGCQAYGDAPAADPPPPAAGNGGSPGSAGASGDAGGGAPVLARTADIPVNGGKIFEAQGVVVTQPAAGTFKAFSSVCTHQGCTVTDVKGGTINCACHGSKFKVADGSPAGGPAPRALAAKKITVDGDSIRLG